MKTQRKQVPLNLPFSFVSISRFNTKETKYLLMDFDKGKGAKSLKLSFFLNTISVEEIIIIKCCLPSMFFLDIVFFTIVASEANRVFISTERITQEGLKFLKKLGLSGLATDVTELVPLTQVKTKVIANLETKPNPLNQLYNLTATEIVILYSISIGLTNPQISDLTCRSYHTVKNHKINIARKIGLQHCNQLSEFIQQLKLSPENDNSLGQGIGVTKE